MELRKLIEVQRDFDDLRRTRFSWSSPITRDDYSQLIHIALGLSGEVGEIADLVKKFERGDFDFDELLARLRLEMADTLIYLFKLAYQAGIDLEQAFLDKVELNEARFPPTSTAEGAVLSSEPISTWGEFGSRDFAAEIPLWAELCAVNATMAEIGQLEVLYNQASVDIPRTLRSGLVVALLAVVVSEEMQRPGRLDYLAIWSSVGELVELHGVSRDQVLDLSRVDLALRELLSEIVRRTDLGASK